MQKPIAILAVVALAVLASTRAHAAGDRSVSVKLHASEEKGAAVIEEVELYAASHALVIGIDDYDNGWPRLSMAVADARLVAAALKTRGFDVTLKLNLNSRQLQNALEEFYLIKGEERDARLFVWFAGHGYSNGGEGFLIPKDAPKPTAGGQFYRKALSLRRIGEYVRLTEAKHAFAVFDSCFSGTVFDSARALPPAAITRATTLPVRQFLTSGDAGQTVSDDGTFRELFLRALNGEENADANGDGYITASEIGLFLTDRVTNLTQSKQTPRYGKLRDKDWDRGDFVFALPLRESRVAAASQAVPPATTPGVAEAARIQQESLFWESIKDSGDADAYKAYIEAFPQGIFAQLARVKLNALRSRPPRGLSGEQGQVEAAQRRLAEEQIARLKTEMAAERSSLAAQKQNQQLALATPPAQRLPITLESATFLPLPKGSEAEYDDGWKFRVTASDGLKAETRSSNNQYRFIYAGAVIFGEDIDLAQYDCVWAGCQGKQPGIELSKGTEALDRLWPLKIGNTAEFTLRPDYTSNEWLQPIDEIWSVKTTVDRVEHVQIGDRSLETFVFKSVGTADSGRRFDQTHWYNPASGLIVKLERAWSGKVTENSVSTGMPGRIQRFQLRRARFPAGAKNALR